MVSIGREGVCVVLPLELIHAMKGASKGYSSTSISAAAGNGRIVPWPLPWFLPWSWFLPVLLLAVAAAVVAVVAAAVVGRRGEYRGEVTRGDDLPKRSSPICSNSTRTVPRDSGRGGEGEEGRGG